MPTYLYRCSEEHKKEISHSIHAEPDISCPECAKPMHRLPQPAEVKFYGKGFYTTDKGNG